MDNRIVLHLSQLQEGRVAGVAITHDNGLNEDVIYGLLIEMPDGRRLVALIQRDPEGGPGFLRIQPYRPDDALPRVEGEIVRPNIVHQQDEP